MVQFFLQWRKYTFARLNLSTPPKMTRPDIFFYTQLPQNNYTYFKKFKTNMANMAPPDTDPPP